jgi:hypothetical protein
MYKFHRRPKTTQERRRNQLDREYGRLYRGRRSLHTLVDAWDDLPRNTQRNWKRFRKTKWKNPNL